MTSEYITESLFNLHGRTALVTGAAGGLGRQISIALSQNGANVVLADIESPIETQETIRKEKGNCVAVQTDVTDEDQIQDMAQTALDAYGKIDILINNAGISQLSYTPTQDLSADEWDRVLGVNLKGTFLCCKHLGKSMIENGHGSIINIASTAGFTGISRAPAYCASKSGVIALTKSLAVEWAQYDIRVNAIAPHYLETDLTRNIRESQKVFNAIVRQIPMKRLGKPTEIVGCLLYLASDASTFTTGSVIPVDGGYLSL